MLKQTKLWEGMRKESTKKYRGLKKSPMNRRMAKSITKICFTLVVAISAVQIGKVGLTNAFFFDQDSVEKVSFSAGFWIPELSLSVSPENPDGTNGWYVTKPCVTLSASVVFDVTIWYEFANDGNPADGGTVYDGNCVEIDHSTDFSAVAVNNANSDWKSEVRTHSFKVDLEAPVVEITSHDDGDTVSGTIGIRGSVEDENPDHYWLVIENSAGTKIVGPGTISEDTSFVDNSLLSWDTTNFANGKYTIKLEARDAAGNKKPNLAPVSSDPEETDDSVDWVEVEVDNTVADVCNLDHLGPNVSLTYPHNGNILSGTVDIEGNITDANPAFYQLVFTRNENGDTTTSGPITQTTSISGLLYQWDTTQIPNDFYKITLSATDACNHTNSTELLSVTIKNDDSEEEDEDEDEDETVKEGDVVINELMWMGSTEDSDDEWIELRNMTDEDIEIGQWRIENAKSGHGTYNLPGNKTIPANGFFLIANFPENSAKTALSVDPDVHSAGISLSNSGNGNLVLKTKSGTVIDRAKGDSWPKGINETGSDPLKQSMERNDEPGDGTSSSDWHTCLDEQCNDTTFWDEEGDNYGTPGSANLSDNDPTSKRDETEEEGNEEKDEEEEEADDEVATPSAPEELGAGSQTTEDEELTPESEEPSENEDEDLTTPETQEEKTPPVEEKKKEEISLPKDDDEQIEPEEKADDDEDKDKDAKKEDDNEDEEEAGDNSDNEAK